MKNAIVVFAVLAFATGANATIIHVPADQPTIQAGIDAAAPDDTILVADGLYAERINFLGKRITVASQHLIDENPLHIANTHGVAGSSRVSYVFAKLTAVRFASRQLHRVIRASTGHIHFVCILGGVFLNLDLPAYETATQPSCNSSNPRQRASCYICAGSALGTRSSSLGW